MNYRNTEMKLDSLVSYLNDEKINLNPVFQRGHVWPIGYRRKLIENVVLGRPIPAIFLYKEAEADSARYSYNILDGKQRLESLMLFIGSKRTDLAIRNWTTYFFPPALRKKANFWIQLPEGKRTFEKLDANLVRDFREYSIPTIEISLNDGSKLDEIISLFVDINQYGVQVSRFAVVHAMGQNNKLLRSVFDMIARKERRGNATFYKAKKTDATTVLKALKVVESASDARVQVDRMWERLLEIALFLRTGQHRKPVDILKSFIRSGRQTRSNAKAQSISLAKISATEAGKLEKVFRFLSVVYSKGLKTSKLATDQTNFYTLATTLISERLMERIDHDALVEKLLAFGRIVDGGTRPKGLNKRIESYIALSSDRTTDSERREQRSRLFKEIVEAL